MYFLDGLYDEDVVGYMYLAKEKFKEVSVRTIRGKEVEIVKSSRQDEEAAHELMAEELQEFNNYLKEV